MCYTSMMGRLVFDEFQTRDVLVDNNYGIPVTIKTDGNIIVYTGRRANHAESSFNSILFQLTMNLTSDILNRWSFTI